jgi:hypothetical protein
MVGAAAAYIAVIPNAGSGHSSIYCSVSHTATVVLHDTEPNRHVVSSQGLYTCVKNGRYPIRHPRGNQMEDQSTARLSLFNQSNTSLGTPYDYVLSFVLYRNNLIPLFMLLQWIANLALANTICVTRN